MNDRTRGSKRRSKPSAPSTDPLPRYQVVAAELTAAIADGTYAVGALLPTEHELCAAYSVSRFTAREALRQLSDAGMVMRKPRTGTVVVSREGRRPFVQTLESIDDLMQYSADTVLETLRQATVPASALGILSRKAGHPIPAALLGDDPWIFLECLRHDRGDGPPVCVTRVYLNPLLRGIGRRIPKRPGAIYKLIEAHYGARVARVEQRLSATTLDAEDAASLKVRQRSAALRMLRYFYDGAGRLLEISDSLHPPERFSYAMTIQDGRGVG